MYSVLSYHYHIMFNIYMYLLTVFLRMGCYWKLFFFLISGSSERGQILEGMVHKVCRIDKSSNYYT